MPIEKIVLGGGCFWCTEGIFKEIRGVKSVTSGYAGGQIDKPNYEQVASGITNHAEVIQVKFDPKEVSYKDILYIFFRTHDPTTMNRQGYDAGTQYRSVIFYADKTQEKVAQDALEDAQKEYKDKIVTEILPLENFYTAEDYHQDYYEKNPNKPYCTLVIDPKIQKLRKNFKQYLK